MGENRDPSPDERESGEPPAGQQNREREGPGSGTEERLPDVPGERVSPELPDPRPDADDDERADREAEETFPASDPPANY